MDHSKIIVKFNGGLGAILCSKCRVIIKTGESYTEEELQYSRGEIDYLPAQYCETCKNQENDKTTV